MFQAIDLSKAYHRRPVVEKLSFSLPAGCCLGVEGENGSGKTTLLRMLAQTLLPDSGDILYKGKSVLGDRHFLRRHLGYVPQLGDLVPSLTAAQQLKLWQSACGCKAPLPGDVCELLRLQELLPVKISEMSGGMQRRVSIAMALSTSPEILIMDEVTASLDEHFREALLAYLENYLRLGGRMVWCSHLPEESGRLCDRVLPLSKS